MKNKLIAQFLNAVNTWKFLVQALTLANKANNSQRKSDLMRSMFYWRKECEKLKSSIDCLRLSIR